MAAEIPGELNAAALTSILRQFVTGSLNRNAAATLTVAFEIRRADCLSRVIEANGSAPLRARLLPTLICDAAYSS